MLQSPRIIPPKKARSSLFFVCAVRNFGKNVNGRVLLPPNNFLEDSRTGVAMVMNAMGYDPNIRSVVQKLILEA